MDIQKTPATERVAKTLEPLLTSQKQVFDGKDVGYFYKIAEYFTDITSEKYSLLLFSCSCYILYKMNIEDLLKFKFYRKDFFTYSEHVMPLFKQSYDKSQILNGLYRYCLFIMLQKNIDISKIIIF